VSEGGITLDRLAQDIVNRSGLRFVLASDDTTRDIAFRLRYQAVMDQGWQSGEEYPDGREHDDYDRRAVHVLAWDLETPVATGRLVLPPGRLPTEEACGIIVEPAGRVVDVGRMTVAREWQGPGHSGFIALLARLSLEVRAREFEFACGIMSARARSVLRLLGLPFEVLAADIHYWGESRAPVRFGTMIDPATLSRRWKDSGDVSSRT
jgi:hypothetical protein